MQLVTRKSECKKIAGGEVLIKSPRDINRKITDHHTPKYCIIVKPFHESFLPYKQIVFRGVTFSDDFTIELIRGNEAMIICNRINPEGLFHADNNDSFRLMS